MIDFKKAAEDFLKANRGCCFVPEAVKNGALSEIERFAKRIWNQAKEDDAEILLDARRWPNEALPITEEMEKEMWRIECIANWIRELKVESK